MVLDSLFGRMSVRSYRPSPDDDHLATNTDILEDWPQRMARENLIPQIAKKTRNALNTTPVYVEHFQMVRNARRCSCFYVEEEPSMVCKLCFGVGMVGGYQKRGTKVDVLDVTSPYTVCVNTRPMYGKMTRPVQFWLQDTAVKGTIEFKWEPVKNIGIIDSLQLLDSTPEGTSVEYSVRTDTDLGWIPVTEAALTQRLALAVPMRFRVELRRETTETPLPKFIGMRCSYRTHKYTAIRCDIPRFSRSTTLEDLGIYNSFTQQNFVFGNDVRSIDNNDFFVVLQDQTRWKVNEWQDNRILGINTSWDVICRLIQPFDRYAKIPLGVLDILPTQMPPDAIRSMQTETDIYDSKGNTHGRLPGERADIDRAHSLAVGVEPGALAASKPIAER